MNVNVYLPDDLGAKAKEADLPFSQLLRDAVTNELERRESMAATLEDSQVYEVAVEDEDGRVYTGRITGKRIAVDERTEDEVFVTTDERVIAYDARKYRYWVLQDPEHELRDWLADPAAYSDAMIALGVTPVIDL